MRGAHAVDPRAHGCSRDTSPQRIHPCSQQSHQEASATQAGDPLRIGSLTLLLAREGGSAQEHRLDGKREILQKVGTRFPVRPKLRRHRANVCQQQASNRVAARQALLARAIARRHSRVGEGMIPQCLWRICHQRDPGMAVLRRWRCPLRTSFSFLSVQLPWCKRTLGEQFACGQQQFCRSLHRHGLRHSCCCIPCTIGGRLGTWV
jgi:hypothetical protein